MSSSLVLIGSESPPGDTSNACRQRGTVQRWLDALGCKPGSVPAEEPDGQRPEHDRKRSHTTRLDVCGTSPAQLAERACTTAPLGVQLLTVRVASEFPGSSTSSDQHPKWTPDPGTSRPDIIPVQTVGIDKDRDGEKTCRVAVKPTKNKICAATTTVEPAWRVESGRVGSSWHRELPGISAESKAPTTCSSSLVSEQGIRDRTGDKATVLGDAPSSLVYEEVVQFGGAVEPKDIAGVLVGDAGSEMSTVR